MTEVKNGANHVVLRRVMEVARKYDITSQMLLAWGKIVADDFDVKNSLGALPEEITGVLRPALSSLQQSIVDLQVVNRELLQRVSMLTKQQREIIQSIELLKLCTRKKCGAEPFHKVFSF